ncbi:MAG: cobyrinic acid a,c-diamide synthase, partial [Lachnospiraceae bacterium]|nr:cobyrinic acid a,c-diamide synthase [Lachnospiraceae bacterium]
RHLGLMMPDEIADIREQLQKSSEELQKTVSLEAVLQIAENAKELEGYPVITDTEVCAADRENRPVIAVAKDEAFCFYYEDNLHLLEESGAKIEYFSPIHDTGLPDGCCGILLGGGYPELYADNLSQNTAMLHAIKKAEESEMPIVAECGGFMYLHSAIADKEERFYSMTGILPTKCYNTGKLVRFGYIELEGGNNDFLPKGERIRGHEFHYYDREDNGADCLAIKPVIGKSYLCIITKGNSFVGFPHLYYPSNPIFAENFVAKAREYKERKEL